MATVGDRPFFSAEEGHILVCRGIGLWLPHPGEPLLAAWHHIDFGRQDTVKKTQMRLGGWSDGISADSFAKSLDWGIRCTHSTDRVQPSKFTSPSFFREMADALDGPPSTLHWPKSLGEERLPRSVRKV